MANYDFECPDGHIFEVRCSIADRVKEHLCTQPVLLPEVQKLLEESTLPQVDKDFVHSMVIDPPDALIAAMGVPKAFLTGPTCGKVGKQVHLTVPVLFNTIVADYPGSKSLKAGYVHSHGPKKGTRVQSGYGGMVSPERKHLNPIANNVIPDPVRFRKPSTD